jgi:hypothetical protein
MVSEIHELVGKYHAWLKDKTDLKEIQDWVEITTPYLDRHNDYLQIYARKNNGGLILSDDGYILTDLEQSGCKIESPKRTQLLNLTLNGFGVKMEGKELRVTATPDNFPVKKHNLLQAMLAINDMFYLAEPMVSGIFYEDVVSWLDLSDIRYTPQVKFTGKSGYDQSFDFVIPKSKAQPERILKTVSRPNRDAAISIAFAWQDTKEVRAKDSRAFALLNDQERAVPAEVEEALKSYEVVPVPWSQREKVRLEFAA